MPTKVPDHMVLTRVLMDEWAPDRDKPTALGTPFRHSDAAGCARALAYTAAGAPKTGLDTPSRYAARIGEAVHEAFQAAVAARYPGWEFEGGIGDADGSGHYDGHGPLEATDGTEHLTVIEIKTMGGTKFRIATGAPQGRNAVNKAAGPNHAHVVQLALNVAATAATRARLIYLSNEAVAVHRGWAEFDRFCAEWEFTRDELLPIAAAEKRRVKAILEAVAGGFLPPRDWPGDGESKVIADPVKTVFPCGYCAHQGECLLDGPGHVRLRRRWSS